MIKWDVISLGVISALSLNTSHTFASTVPQFLEDQFERSTIQSPDTPDGSPRHQFDLDQTVEDLNARVMKILTTLKYDDRNAPSAIAVLKGDQVTDLIQKHLNKFYRVKGFEDGVNALQGIFSKEGPEAEQMNDLLDALNLTIRHTRGRRLSEGFQQHKIAKAETATLKEQNSILRHRVEDLETKIHQLEASIKESGDLNLKIQCDLF